MVRADDIPSDGKGYADVERVVDKLAKKLIGKKNLPGLSIAVSKNGRLLLSKGYGWAKTGSGAIPMRVDSQILIGSVTKCCITGPAGVKLLGTRGTGRKLYGKRNSIFGDRFDADIRCASQRFNPIAAMAISPSNKTYTWYSNYRVSIGSSTDLDKHTVPIPYKLPAGCKPKDIRGIAISRQGRFYLWYDGKNSDDNEALNVATGRWTDLRKVQSTSVKVPAGKTFRNIVAFAIAKSNDHVYAWYEDGTVSSGTSTDLGKYFSPTNMQTIKSGTGYEANYKLRGVGINSDDKVFYWYSNGKRSAGTSTQRGKYVSPESYSIPAIVGFENWPAWYREITCQHLLDHKAGYWGSGDPDGAPKMFGVAKDKITYEQAHRHFLRTRKLLTAPGTKESYSNHGFGVWTLIIEKLSGKTFRKYVRDDFLKPMRLHNSITPRSAPPGPKHAWGHKYRNGKPVPIEFVNKPNGLAAGGYLSSAGHLVLLMKKLSAKYTTEQLDRMGWGRSDSGDTVKLSHNGQIEGGTCVVRMFKVKSTDIHVAVITNIWTETKPLNDLAEQIALQALWANPGAYDLWNPPHVPRSGNSNSPRSGTLPKRAGNRPQPRRTVRTRPVRRKPSVNRAGGKPPVKRAGSTQRKRKLPKRSSGKRTSRTNKKRPVRSRVKRRRPTRRSGAR